MMVDDHQPQATPDTDQIYRNRLSLRFANPRLEAAFRRDYSHQSLRQVRVSLLVGGFFYAAFGLLDTHIVPKSTEIIWVIRYAVVCPVIAAVFALSFTRYFERHMETAMVIVGIVASFGIVAMIGVAVPPGSYLYYAGLLLVATCIYTFIRLGFVPASLVNWGTVALYEAIALSTGTTPAAILLNNSFFLVSINIVGMSACYYMEHYARTDYLKRRLIRRQTVRLQAALTSVEKARHKAEEQSRRDALTGLFNRRHFQDMLTTELERTRRSPSPTSLIIVDIDRFKRINDTYGHTTGDQVLRQVAGRVGLGLRRPDTACRYGGEEFTILLPSSDARSARNVAERLRADIETITTTESGEPLSITASLGVATIPVGERWDPDTLINRADQALYAAKKGGRNRVVVWTGNAAAIG
jgi:diguanylate cyclase (GGDEF)-like protein